MKVSAELSAEEIVTIMEDHGGYTAGVCLLCKESGWLGEYRFGVYYDQVAKGGAAYLRHKEDCPLGIALREASPPEIAEGSPRRIGMIPLAGKEPWDGKYYLLWGPSGYNSFPMRVDVCRYDPEFRPRQPWINYAGDSFTDGGELPTHWSYLPKDFAPEPKQSRSRSRGLTFGAEE